MGRTQKQPDDAPHISDLVREIENNAGILFAKARDIAGAASDLRDDARRIRLITDNPNAVQAIPEAEATSLRAQLQLGVRSLSDVSEGFVELGDRALNVLPTVGPTGVMSVISATMIESPAVSEPVASVFRLFSEAQHESDSTRDLVGKCAELMNALDCEKRYGSAAASSNSDLLKQAAMAYRTPVFSDHNAGSPLFAMRQCLDETVESLKRRLPTTQVRGGLGDKIRAIMQAAGKPGIDEGIADQLAREAIQLHDKISGEAKRDDLPREATLSLLSASLNFLYRLLISVDGSRLKAT